MKLKINKNNFYVIKYGLIFLFFILFISSCGGCGGSNSSTSNNPVSTTKPTGYGNLTGIATLEDSTDYSGVIISISSPSTASVTTGPDGKYSFTNVDAGTYTITASKQDFKDDKKTLGVINGQTTSGNFSLVYTVTKRLQQGWSSFTSKNYSDTNGSIYYFNKALNVSPTTAERSVIYSGLGYSYLKQTVGSSYDLNLEKTNITNAYNNFVSAVSSDTTNVDAKAGKLAAEINYATYDTNPKNIYTDIKSLGETVLTSSPNYSFSYDTNYNYVDIYAYVSYACLMIEDKSCATSYSQLALSVEPANEIALSVQSTLNNLPKKKIKSLLW